MSQYTTELRFLVQQGYDLGLRDYPIFDESYRNALNKKIVDEYYFREIGQETPERFKHYLNHTMNMIMPYYNQLYKSELLKIDPLSTYRDTETMKRDIGTTTAETSTETGKTDSTGKSIAAATAITSQTDSSVGHGSSTSNVTGTETVDEDSTNNRTENKFSVDSDTPGGLIAIGDIKTNTWASSANMAEGTIGDIATNDRTTTSDTDTTGTTDQTTTNEIDATSESDQTVTNTGSVEGLTTGNRNVNLSTVDEYLKSKFGFTGNQSKMLEAYRKTFLNIDQGIIRELNNLFMGVY